MRDRVKQTRRQRTKNRRPDYAAWYLANLKATIRLHPMVDLARWENEGGAVTSPVQKGISS